MARRSPVPASPSPDPSHSHKRGKLLFAVLAPSVFLVGLGAFIEFSHQANQNRARLETTEHEAQTARDAWQAAARQVRADRVALLTAYAPPGSPFRMMGFGRPPTRNGLRPATADPATLLARNASALAAFRHALTLPYRDAPDKTTPDPFGVRFSVRSTSDFMALACLLILDGDEKQAKGNIAGAANAYLDAIQMGQTLTHGGAVASLSTGIAYQKNGQGKLWKLLAKMDNKTARDTAQRLQNLCADTNARASFTDALREEKARGEASLQQTFHDPKQLQRVQTLASAIQQMQTQRGRGMGGRGMISAFGGTTNAAPVPPVTFWGRVSQKWEEWRMVREFDASINEQIALSLLPYQAQQQAQQGQPSAQGQRTYLTVSSNGMSVSSFGSGGSGAFSSFYTSYGSPQTLRMAQEEWTNNEAENRLLITALAIQAYRADHAGHDPAALSDLVPTYLPRLPNDPYALPVALLLWKPAVQNTPAATAATSGILYSVGPDGKDDGGTVPQGSIRQMGMGRGFYPFASFRRAVGKGDLVAGKTTP